VVNVYVLNKDGSPLMPIHSFGRVKRMLKSGKARVVKQTPFIIRMNVQIENPVLDECLIGIDPGRTNIGLCVIDSKGRVLFASDVETRNKAIAKLMLERKRHRQASRRGERKARQRLAVRHDGNGLARATEFWRMLPGYAKPVCCKVIRNTETRFLHRKRKKGWLTPTARQLLDTHINAVKKVMSFLPVEYIAIEVNRFDFVRMENPGIRNWEYQMGKLAGYKDVNEAVFIQQKGRCLLCGKKIHSYHHIVPRSMGGSNSVDNIAGLCEEHHYGENGVHKSEAAAGKLRKKKEGLSKKYGALSVINQIMPYLLEELNAIRPVSVTTGYETQAVRRTTPELLPKEKDDGTHYMDAWCIAVSALDGGAQYPPDFMDSFWQIKQYRRHDRANIKAQKERTYYLDGKAVAHNRRKRTGQSDGPNKWDSLAEFRKAHPEDVCRLTVKKSQRSYNNRQRVMPGAVFTYKGRQYILAAQQSNGTRWYGVGEKKYFPSKECNIVTHNTGLVFVP